MAVEDKMIVMLYFERSEDAIRESETKYGKYCYAVAYNILRSKEDSEECVNDTWAGAWNAIPPQKPAILQSFLARITRNIAIDRYRHDSAQKRTAEVTLPIDEYYECISDGSVSMEDELLLKQVIDSFLAGLDKRRRVIFMRRYWYSMSVKEIAESMRLSESHVSVILHRTRTKFKEHLMKEGILL